MELKLEDYHEAIQLNESPQIPNNKAWEELVLSVLQELGVSLPIHLTIDQKLRAMHGVLATVDEYTLSDGLIKKIETIASGSNNLQETINPLGLTTIAENYNSLYSAAEQSSVWVGDITTLGVDAIVNAANIALLGCRVPNHACIDNVIHSAAGPRLRDDCATIIQRQGSLEPVGSAKITRGYALKAKYVLHSVGPQLAYGSQPTDKQRQQLVSVYNSCLDLAAEVEDIRTIAFCAISTGLFAFPKEQAAKIALTTVARWLENNPNRFDRIIFNLYSAADAAIYEEILNDQ